MNTQPIAAGFVESAAHRVALAAIGVVFDHAHVRSRSGRGARLVGGGLRAAVDHDDQFPVVRLSIEILADVRDGAADAAGLVIGRNDQAERLSISEPSCRRC